MIKNISRWKVKAQKLYMVKHCSWVNIYYPTDCFKIYFFFYKGSQPFHTQLNNNIHFSHNCIANTTSYAYLLTMHQKAISNNHFYKHYMHLLQALHRLLNTYQHQIFTMHITVLGHSKCTYCNDYYILSPHKQNPHPGFDQHYIKHKSLHCSKHPFNPVNGGSL